MSTSDNASLCKFVSQNGKRCAKQTDSNPWRGSDDFCKAHKKRGRDARNKHAKMEAVERWLNEVKPEIDAILEFEALEPAPDGAPAHKRLYEIARAFYNKELTAKGGIEGLKARYEAHTKAVADWKARVEAQTRAIARMEKREQERQAKAVAEKKAARAKARAARATGKRKKE